MSKVFLSCEGLVKSFPSAYSAILRRPLSYIRAVDNISLSLESGKTLGLVGESGSGKSTTGELLGGLISPDSGTILYHGQEISSLSHDKYILLRRNIQYIFQDSAASMNPGYSVLSILCEPLLTLKLEPNKNKRIKKAKEICSAIGLEQSVLKKRASELSGGQAQRVAIGRAIITSPELIICDEAVSALDLSVQAQILNLLKDLQEQFSTAYLFISHDISAVSFMSDRIAVMKDGQIVEENNTDRLLSTAENEYTRALLAAAF